MSSRKAEFYSDFVESSAAVDFYTPDLNSQSARKLASYLNDSLSEDTYDGEHARRVVGYMDLFGRTKRVLGQMVSMPEEVYDAALLHDNCDALSSENEKYDLLRQGLEECVPEWGVDKAARVLDLVKDVSVVSNFSAKQASRAMPDEISWKFVTSDVDWNRLKALIQGEVRPESFLIKGVELMDKIKNSSTDDFMNLQNLLEVESCIYPALDTLGYNALAAELSSSCNIFRLKRQNRQDLIDVAEKRYKAVQNVEPLNLAKELFGLDDEVKMTWIVNQTEDSVYSGVNCRFGEMDLGYVEEQPVRLRFRHKLIGSQAKKALTKSEDYRALDDYGFMLVVGDENPGNETDQRRALTKIYNNLINRVDNNASITPAQTEAVKKPFFIQGSSEFIDSLDRFGLSDSQTIEKDRKTNQKSPYNVAKVTMLFKVNETEVPVEVQCLTGTFYYLDNKMGVNYHGFYKKNGSKQNHRQSDVIQSRMTFYGSREKLYNFESTTARDAEVQRLLSKLAIDFS